MSIFTENAAARELRRRSEALDAPGRKPLPASIGEGACTDTQIERRGLPRVRTAFRPACVVIGDRVVLGMLRNMSSEGVMIEVDEELAEGQRVAYFWNEQQLVNATVIWTEGNRYGLRNEGDQTVFDPDHSYRSVRVPCRVEATVWIRGDRHRVEVDNLSLGGMRVRGVKAWKGAPLTVCIAGVELCNACVAWTREDGRGENGGKGETGIRFANSLSRSQLAEILSHESVRFDQVTFD
ncbi:MAG: PilZ domain-containing protein [Erythrobacter sp.]